MLKAKILLNNVPAGELIEVVPNKEYHFIYCDEYKGPSVSLEIPLYQKMHKFESFPPFFEGLLPEGVMLEGLLRLTKTDRDDFMRQLILVGGDLIGNVTVEAIE